MLPVLIPVSPCATGRCPDFIEPDFAVRVGVASDVPVTLAIVDDRFQMVSRMNDWTHVQNHTTMAYATYLDLTLDGDAYQKAIESGASESHRSYFLAVFPDTATTEPFSMQVAAVEAW
jgi:hypothetical protein